MEQEELRFGRLVQRYRLAAGWTQEELAERAGLSARAVSDLERGARTQPRPDTVRRLAQALGVAAADRERLMAAAHAEALPAARAPHHPPLPVGNFLGAQPAAPLVARAEELERLRAMPRAVAQGRGQGVLLAGAPGIGKTRLAQELLLHLRAHDFVVGTGRCYEGYGGLPYYPFREALGLVYAAAPGPVQRTVGQRWPDLARLLPEQVDAGPRPPDEGPEAQQRLFAAVRGLLAAVAAQAPVALLLDDLHWADAASLELFLYCARHLHTAPLLLLGTYRDVALARQADLRALLYALRREQLVERLPLRGLDQEGTGALLAALLGTAEVSAELTALLHEQTAGNPFFVQEVLRALLERGDVYCREGRWWRRGLEELVLPESVREAIGERVRRLAAPGPDLLRQASVLGQVFAFGALQALSGRAEPEVEAALEEARALDLVQEVDAERYSFDHALTQQTLYQTLSARRRRQLHRAAGLVLEQGAGGERRAGEIARHLLAGGEQERALPYVLRAGAEAAAVFAHAEAERQYRLAVDLAQQSGDELRAAEARAQLGAELNTLARYEEALVVLERAAATYRAVGERDGLARVLAVLGRVHAFRGTPEQGVELVQEAVQALEQGGPSPALAALYTQLALLLHGSGSYEGQLSAARRASELATVLGDHRLLVGAEALRGLALALLGHADDAMQVWQQALPAAEAAGEQASLAWILGALALGAWVAGELEAGGSYARRSVEASERRGNPVEVALRTTAVGLYAFVRGDWPQARRLYDQSIAMSRAVGEHVLSPYALFGLGWLSLAEGAWEEARQALEQGAHSAERTHNLQAQRWVGGILAELELRAGDPAGALTRVRPLLDRPGLQEWDVNLLLPRLAWAWLELGDLAQAQATLLLALPRLRGQRARLWLVDALRVDALVATRQGRWADAERSLADGLALAGSMPYPYAEGRLLQASGQMHWQREEAAPARERLEAALAIFRRLGARKDAEQTERVLAAVPRST